MNLLIFTALILLVFGLILQSNPKIRTNQCCFVGGCIFAGGVLKEYLYYHMAVSYTHLTLPTICSV